jgi:hypothetical protein
LVAIVPFKSGHWSLLFSIPSLSLSGQPLNVAKPYTSGHAANSSVVLASLMVFVIDMIAVQITSLFIN